MWYSILIEWKRKATWFFTINSEVKAINKSHYPFRTQQTNIKQEHHLINRANKKNLWFSSFCKLTFHYMHTLFVFCPPELNSLFWVPRKLQFNQPGSGCQTCTNLLSLVAALPVIKSAMYSKIASRLPDKKSKSISYTTET